ncbi:hypothetical protein ACFWN2_20370 [Lentzea sp. NPDC058436]|uniref:hypothetical protein n=1 Tax=Lentzea sp. NPDC058436 TaxID=3346499 RepID=UPI00365B04BF
MLRALTLLLVLTACSPAPPDPAELLKEWRQTLQSQVSVRFDVTIEPRRRTFAGVLHVVNGGATAQRDVTAHIESDHRTVDYRSVRVGDESYLQHSGLTLPPGRTFSGMGLNDAPWVGPYTRDLSLDERYYHPGNLLSDVDRTTLRLTEHDGNRYVFTAGGVPHSGGFTNGEVRVVVETDDENRVVRVEQTTPSTDGRQQRLVAVYSQWGTAPDVLLPPRQTVAEPTEVKAGP